MEFYKLSNGNFATDHNMSLAFQITTGLNPFNSPDLYGRFLFGLSQNGLVEKYNPSVEELVAAGQNSLACALYREQTGLTLLESKKHIDSISGGSI